MDPHPQSASRPAQEIKPRLPTARGPALGIGALVLLAAVILLVPSPTPQEALVWLSSLDFARVTRVGPLTELKYRLLRLAGPLLAPFRRNQPQVDIRSCFLRVQADQVSHLSLGTPVSTNTDGGRAWILTAALCDALRQRLKDLPEESNLVGPRLTTFDGGQAQIFAGVNSAPGQVIPAGITMDLLPTISDDSVQLLVSLLATEAVPRNPSNSVGVRTNLDVACRALVPDGGGLLLTPGGVMDATGRRYFGLVSPTAVDAQGRPLKR